MQKPIRLATLTVITGAGVTAFLLLRTAPAHGDSDAGRPQSRAFIAAVAATDGDGNPAKNPAPSARRITPALTAQQRLEAEIARATFLDWADRNPDAQVRLAALIRLRNSLIRQPSIRSDPDGQLHASSPDLRDLRHQQFVDDQRMQIINNPATLTPSARDEFIQREAARWREMPPLPVPEPEKPMTAGSLRAQKKFNQERATLTKPLIDAWERADDHRAELLYAFNNTPPGAARSLAAVQSAEVETAAAFSALFAAAMETETQSRAWNANEWQGYGETPSDPAPATSTPPP